MANINRAKYPNFFNKPTIPLQKKYEVLRSYHVEDLKAREVAKKFNISVLTYNTWNRDFGKTLRNQEPLIFYTTLHR